MAITFVGSAQNSEDGSTTGGLTVTLSGSYQADDLALMTAKSRYDGTAPALTVGTATGWTKHRQDDSTIGQDNCIALFYKFLTSGSETDPVFNTDIAKPRGVAVHIFRGVDTVTPFDVTETTNTGSNTANPTNPTITPANPNGLLLLFHSFTHDDHTVIGAPTTPSGLTLGESRTSSGQTMQGFANAYKLDYGAAGLITPTAWTHTASPTNIAEYSTYTIALRAATAGSSYVPRGLLMGVG